MNRHLFFSAAVLAASVALTGCSSELQVENQQMDAEGPVISYIVSIPATKANDDMTRALSTSGDNDATLNATWSGETVYAYYGTTQVGTLTPSSTGTTTTLTGTLSKSGGFELNDELTLYFLKDKSNHESDTRYGGQDGTYTKIGTDYDFATATVTVSTIAPASVSNANILKTTDATFSHSQAVTKFTFNHKGSAVNVTSLTITSDNLVGSPLTITPASGTSTIFAALKNTGSGSQPYNFAATVGGEAFSATKSATLVDGNYYRTTIDLMKNAAGLNFNAISDQTYANTALTPSFTITDGSYTLVAGTDYETPVAWANNTDAGTNSASVTVTLKGNYSGTLTKNFTILKATPVITIGNGVENAIIDKDATLNISASVSLGGSIDNTQYASSETSVATVSNAGVITGVGAGQTTITVRSTNTSNLDVATKTFTVYVREGISGGIDQPGTGASW
ncbi:MAG: Ig-like domain-containing protein [Prevotella sp.]|nr:Ig-like domain-containing protein [Prevotella sp.]